MSEVNDLGALVDRLRRDRRQHPYGGRREYSQAARAVADLGERLIGSGQAAQAVPALRKAVDRITRALAYMDDSSGIIGDDLQTIMSRYARACAAAPPKPVALASWLVALACSGTGWPRVRLREFADALGERGLAEVARLVEKEESEAEKDSYTAAFSVRDLREQLAELSGDLDRYIVVLAQNLDGARQFGRIVHALRDAGRHLEAIEWARRGLADAAGHPETDRLRDTLVEMLLADGQPDAALEIRRDRFARHPTADSYRALAAINAEVDGDDVTPWALQILTERVARQPYFAGELLAVLAILGRHDEVWRLAQEHRNVCSDQLWLTVLEQRRIDHPEDVLAAYQEMIEQKILNSADKYRYRRAVTLLLQLRDVYARASGEAAFTTYLNELRVRHTRRPTFIKALDSTAW